MLSLNESLANRWRKDAFKPVVADCCYSNRLHTAAIKMLGRLYEKHEHIR